MIRPFGKSTPKISRKAFVADTARIVGDVVVRDFSGVWFGAILRGDCCAIEVGKNTSIQDNCVVHGDPGSRIVIGDNVTIGHSAVVHGCTVKDNVLVGMSATILNGAKIGSYSMIGAGALVTQGEKIPERSLVLGVPAKVVRELTDEEVRSIQRSADEYAELCRKYLGRSLG